MTAGHAFARAMPVLEIADMGRSLAYYKEKLGFEASTWGDPPTFAIVQRGTVSIALAVVPADAVSVSRRTWAAYVYVADVNALHRELTGLGVDVPEPPETRFYGCREFVVDDPDGHIIAFGQVLQPDPLGPGLGARTGRADPAERRDKE